MCQKRKQTNKNKNTWWSQNHRFSSLHCNDNEWKRISSKLRSVLFMIPPFPFHLPYSARSGFDRNWEKLRETSWFIEKYCLTVNIAEKINNFRLILKRKVELLRSLAIWREKKTPPKGSNVPLDVLLPCLTASSLKSTDWCIYTSGWSEGV